MNQTTNSSISSSALPSNVNGHHAVTNDLFNVGHDGTSGLHPLVQPGELIHSCQQPGSWALTFDDGPSDMTSALLDTLSLRHVKATFFVVSDSLRQGDRPEVLRRAYNEGHQIALHSRTHAHLADLPHEQVYAEIKDNLDDVAAIIGAHPRYFRCPYGECGGSVLDVLHELGLIPIQWNVDTKDFEAGHTGDDTLQVVHLAIMVANGELDLNTASAQLGSIGELGSGLENGAIQLQHDTIPESIRITDAIIDIVTTANFRPMTVAECINDSNGAYTL
ncbi:hypothetical protein BDF22DRAFT_683177 [Syncephalis plumigaleata]|nr:hypothetical protein BDF22DRAFT_683177 [Syncephalis plumigaleata]